MYNVVEYIGHFSSISLGIPILLYLAMFFLRSSRLRIQKYIHIVALLCFLSVIFEILALELISKGIHTIFLFNIQDIIQFGLLCWLYLELMLHDRYRYYLIAGIVIYLLAFVVIGIYYSEHENLQSYIWAVQAIIMALYSHLYFRYMLQQIHTEPIPDTGIIDTKKMREKWRIDGSKDSINSAIFFYFFLSFSLFIMEVYFNSPQYGMKEEADQVVWASHNLNNIVKNLLFAQGIYRAIKALRE